MYQIYSLKMTLQGLKHVGVTYSLNKLVTRHVTLCRSRLCLKCDGTRAETRFGLSAKRTSPFKSARASVQSTTGSQCARISGSTAGYTMFRGSVRVLATHSIRQIPLHFPSTASPCAIKFQLNFSMITNDANVHVKLNTGLSW
jgi:hypothetical protein